jgi:hypothetical protein
VDHLAARLQPGSHSLQGNGGDLARSIHASPSAFSGNCTLAGWPQNEGTRPSRKLERVHMRKTRIMYAEQAAAVKAEVPCTAQTKQTDIERIARIWRGKLQKLCCHRYVNHYLPDSDEGRAMLTALLCLGLTDEAADAQAPWITAAELHGLKRKARWLKWDMIGALIQLTYAERQACKLWRFMPCDVSAEEVKRRRSEKRAAAEAKRKKRKREELRNERDAMRQTNKRDDAVLRMLDLTGKDYHSPDAPPPYCHWLPVSELVKQAKRCDAFRCPDGSRPRDLRRLVNRTVEKLKAFGAIETKLKPGKRGPVLWVRKVTAADLENEENCPVFVGKADAFCHGDGRTPPKKPKLVVIQGLKA